MLQHLANGDTADLRRLDDPISAPAYWRFAARHEVLGRLPGTWGPIVRALAILTPKGPPGERPDLHDSKRKFGAVLCDGGSADWPGTLAPGSAPRPVVSERRLAQLLAARADQRSTLLTRAVRAIAARRDPHSGVDVRDLAWAFFSTDRPGTIAEPYYRRLDGAQRAAEKTDETTETDADDA